MKRYLLLLKYARMTSDVVLAARGSGVAGVAVAWLAWLELVVSWGLHHRNFDAVRCSSPRRCYITTACCVYIVVISTGCGVG